MDEMVVVDTRSSQEAFRSDRAVSIVDEEMLFEDSPRTTPEALWETPGVFVQETSYGAGSPIVRGMVGPQLLLVVDGIRFNNAVYRTGPVQYLNLIDPFSIDRIEVLRGPGSVLYGSDAMGGVIEAFPRSPKPCHENTRACAGGRTVLRLSSADLGRVAHGLAGAGWNGSGILGGITYKVFDNLRPGSGMEEQLYSGYHNLSALAVAEQRLAFGDLKFGYLFGQIPDAGRTDQLYVKNSLQVYDNDDHLVWGRFHAGRLPLRTDANYALSFQNFFERKDTSKMANDLVTPLSTVRDEVTDQTMGQNLDLTTPILADRLRVKYGLMWYRDWVGADSLSQTAGGPWKPLSQKSYPDGSTYDNYGGFLFLEGEPLRSPGGHVLRLAGGYRLHAMAGHAPASAGLPSVDFSDMGNIFQGSVQYLYRDQATAALTYSQGFRAPNLQEAVQLGDTGKFFHIPNPDLQPESADTLELMSRIKIWRIMISESVYVSFLDDLIKREKSSWQGQTTVGGKEVWRNVNGGDGLLWGAEGYLFADLGLGCSFRGNLTYTWGEEYVPGENLPLTRIPPLFGTAILRYSTGGQHWAGFAETSIRAAGGQDRLSLEDREDPRIPKGGTPSWWTWNLRLGVETDYHFRVSLVVENLLDKLYKYHASGIYAPGTNVLVTLEAFL